MTTVDEERQRASLRPYPQYAAVNATGVGRLPSHWDVIRLRHVVTLRPSPTEVANLAGDTLVTFLPMEAIGDDGTYDASDERPLSDVLSGYSYFRDGDVLRAKVTPCFENGKGALVEHLKSGIGFGTTELFVLRPGSSIDARFLYYLTVSAPFSLLGEATIYGAHGVKRVDDDFVRNFRLGLPPLPEQHAIAAFLDRETAWIDALVAAKRELTERLVERHWSVVRRVVAQGLDQHAPTKPSGVTWLGEVPAHWEILRLKRTTALLRNGIWGNEPSGDSDDIACIRVADFDRERLTVPPADFTIRSVEPRERYGRVLRRGDLLLEKSGGGDQQPVGRVVSYHLDVPAVCSNFVARIVAS